jgi:hypothetical protein
MRPFEVRIPYELLQAEFPEVSERWRRVLGGDAAAERAVRSVWWLVANIANARGEWARVRRITLSHPAYLLGLFDSDREEAPGGAAAASRAWHGTTRVVHAVVRARFASEEGMAPGTLQATVRLVALHLVESVRDGMWRIWRSLAIAMAGVMLVIASHVVYPLQPRLQLLTICAIEVCVIAGLALWAMLAAERNAVLSRLTGGTAGKINWTWGFGLRLVGWVAFPIFGVVAARFPDIGDLLLRLFTPFEQMLK